MMRGNKRAVQALAGSEPRAVNDQLSVGEIGSTEKILLLLTSKGGLSPMNEWALNYCKRIRG
jgi:hypothetical protein